MQVREDGHRSGLHLEMFTSAEGAKGGQAFGVGRDEPSLQGVYVKSQFSCTVKNLFLCSPDSETLRLLTPSCGNSTASL